MTTKPELPDTVYDAHEVFESQLKPLLEKAHAIASEHQLPLVAYVQYGQEPHDDETSRAQIAAMVNIPGERAAPMFHAVGKAFTEPMDACLTMLRAFMGHKALLPADEDLSGSKDAVQALLGHAGQIGHA